MFWKITSIVALVSVIVIGLYSAIVARNLNIDLVDLREDYLEFQDELLEENINVEEEKITEEPDEEIVREDTKTFSEDWSIYADNETGLIFDLPPDHSFGRLSGEQILVSTITKFGNDEDLFPAITIDRIKDSNLLTVFTEESKAVEEDWKIVATTIEKLEHDYFNFRRKVAPVSLDAEQKLIVYYFEYDGDVYKVTEWESLAWEHLEEFLQRIRPIK